MAIDHPFARHVAKDVVAHKKKVYCLDWSCNGKRLATGSNDQTDKSEKHEMEFKLSERLVCLLWHPSSPDSFAAAAYEKVIRIYDTRSGKSATQISTPGKNLYLAWSPHDPNLMATGAENNTVSFIDLRRNKVLKSVKNNQLVNELAFTQDGKLFLQATDSGVEMYKLPDHEKLSSLNGHTGTVLTITLDSRDRYLASGGADAIAAVWDLETLSCIRTCTQMDGEIKTLSISHDSQYLAYAGEQDMVVIEALQEGRKPWMVPLSKPPRMIESLAWNPKYPVLAITGAFSEGGSHSFGNVTIYAPL
ncbi:WD40 repeat-like protein [Coccomyxa subellipsoidea C-169]|uniref:WD40 repeat-like protein n=1 Tax=Coccomyxa subellipsoidea (strain C-169) TaxID=574566 RepID=I0YRP6_COCSC|nr:WD40 repeat-like protein [Coccomyxa subellipsoidea C-169]EIE21065.1 WD40 repeat-like protein [Coccomyxa subellipsoidea C-169]|eukprot:XP_005645609.1 WD40 repeat-like protein [Coccomyxa subellipsoidea C-169]